MTETAKADTAKSKPAAHQLGDVIKVKPSGIVTRPDGTTHIVIKGAFYLDQVGTFLVDGAEVTVA